MEGMGPKSFQSLNGWRQLSGRTWNGAESSKWDCALELLVSILKSSKHSAGTSVGTHITPSSGHHHHHRRHRQNGNGIIVVEWQLMGKNIILISVLSYSLCGKIDFHFGFYLNREHQRGRARGSFSIVVHFTSAEQCQDNNQTCVTYELVEENFISFHFILV